MDSILEVQKRIIPDLIQVMQKRYEILRYVRLMQPVGRRSLSQTIHITERVLRGEIQFLKEQDLLSVTSSGMSLTEEGNMILNQLEDIMRDISGLPELEIQLAEMLNIDQCIVVVGDSETSEWDKTEIARACIKSMKKVLKDKNIVAVTGGSTIAAIADTLTPDFSKKDLLFVPARGGMGTDVKNQANTICSKMAENTNGTHMALYVPDHVSTEAYESLIQEPSVKEVLAKIHSADCLIHGVGDAITMAKRRNASDDDMQLLTENHAAAEAFGYYFNENGEIVHKVKTIGLQLADLKQISHIYAVAGGKSKAKAIKAYMKVAPKNTVLVTDEAAALEILKG